MFKKGITFTVLLLCICLLASCASSKKTGAESVEQIYQASLPSQKEKADIFVEPVEGISENFMRGADISSFLSEEESGVLYYDEEGKQEDLFRLLADGGINWIRVRVWNDPYDGNGHGYGGGNCDTEKAARIGRKAAEYGMKLLVDFHYSDFWADPSKQMTPKAWAKMDLEDKKKAIAVFTEKSLTEIIEGGAEVGMVQIGNEINNGMAGEGVKKEAAALLKEAAESVRKVSDAKVAVHFTNLTETDKLIRWTEILQECGVDYDVLGLSYYMYWHGGLDGLEKTLYDLRKKTGREVCVLETAYPWTTEDGDGSANSFSGKPADGYPATVQGQADAIRDVCERVVRAGGIGVFYWEPAWIPVHHYKGEADILAENQKAWETYGAGWASSYAASYDPDDAGRYYGGSGWDNQALFDFDGRALSSLNVWKWLYHGAEGALVLQYIEEPSLEITAGAPYELPARILVQYSDRAKSGYQEVTWDTSGLNTTVPGAYDIPGQTAEGLRTVCHLTVSNVNLVKNPSLEDDDTSMWKYEFRSGGECADIQDKSDDAYDGSRALHFWSESDMDFTISQTVTAAEGGIYTFSFYAQGGDLGDDDSFEGYVEVNGEEKKTPFTLTGWQLWQNVRINGIKLNAGDRITFGIRARASAKAWGTFDSFSLSIQ